MTVQPQGRRRHLPDRRRQVHVQPGDELVVGGRHVHRDGHDWQHDLPGRNLRSEVVASEIQLDQRGRSRDRPRCRIQSMARPTFEPVFYSGAPPKRAVHSDNLPPLNDDNGRLRPSIGLWREFSAIPLESPASTESSLCGGSPSRPSGMACDRGVQRLEPGTLGPGTRQARASSRRGNGRLRKPSGPVCQRSRTRGS